MDFTLDEAIKRAREAAFNLEWEAECIRRWGKENDTDTKLGAINCEKRAKEHRQLAEWLKELKQLRELTRWTPVSKGLPKENEKVIASTKYSVYPETRYTKEGWEWNGLMSLVQTTGNILKKM